jgi:hypothetical protein
MINSWLVQGSSVSVLSQMLDILCVRKVYRTGSSVSSSRRLRLVGNLAARVVGEQLLARAGLIHECPQRIDELATPAEDYGFIG